MATSKRIKANSLSLTIAGTDYWADLSTVTLQSEDAAADVNTFYDASLGGRRDWFFTVSGVQSTEDDASTSFWRAMWAAAGTEVAFVYQPHGRDSAGTVYPASVDRPTFTGTVRIPAKGSFMLGGEASADGTFAFDGVRMDVVGDVALNVS